MRSPALWICLFALAISLFVYPNSQQLVASDKSLITVYADGEYETIVSSAATVGEALEKMEITLQEGDLVEPAKESAINLSTFNINVYRAKPVLVSDGSETTVVHSAYHNPRLVAEHAGFDLHSKDIVTASVIDDFLLHDFAGNQVTIDKATQVKIVVDGQTVDARTHTKTVQQVLDEYGITLRDQDFTRPSLGTHVKESMNIEIVRVGSQVVSIEESIPFEVKTITDYNKPFGLYEEKSAGENGTRLVTYEVSLHNGQEVSRKLVSDSIVKEVQHKVIVRGGKIPQGADQDILRIIKDAASKYDIDLERAIRIARCESTFNPYAVNYNYTEPSTGTHPSGLYQHVEGYWPARAAKYGYEGASVFDPVANANVTMGMWRDGSAGLWECR